jgi:polysaccharide deacetylase family protein (PEP-CTERM system associated)
LADTAEIMNALSFDVEDWYQVTAFDDVLDRASWSGLEYRLDKSLGTVLRVLDEFNVTATFFILARNLIDHPEIVDMIADRGHEIASHGTNHSLIYEQTPEEFRRDLLESVERIRCRRDVPVTGYRAPSFSITRRSLWALDILAECGFEYDSSIVPMSRSLYGIPDAEPFPGRVRGPNGAEILEFPITSRKILGRKTPFCGGAYFRLCPLFLMKRWISEVNRGGQPVIIYLHPWELGPDHPVIARKNYRTFHYTNLRSTERKLRRLLQHIRFGPVREVLRRHVG